jgi:hypothetical protein
MGFNYNLVNEAKSTSIEDLKLLHTRALLAKLNSVRSVMSQLAYSFDVDDGVYYSILGNYKELLKDELATREHIPNKLESKKIRQEKAKRKK